MYEPQNTLRTSRTSTRWSMTIPSDGEQRLIWQKMSNCGHAGWLVLEHQLRFSWLLFSKIQGLPLIFSAIFVFSSQMLALVAAPDGILCFYAELVCKAAAAFVLNCMRATPPISTHISAQSTRTLQWFLSCSLCIGQRWCCQWNQVLPFTRCWFARKRQPSCRTC